MHESRGHSSPILIRRAFWRPARRAVPAAQMPRIGWLCGGATHNPRAHRHHAAI